MKIWIKMAVLAFKEYKETEQIREALFWRPLTPRR